MNWMDGWMEKECAFSRRKKGYASLSFSSSSFRFVVVIVFGVVVFVYIYIMKQNDYIPINITLLLNILNTYKIIKSKKAGKEYQRFRGVAAA